VKTHVVIASENVDWSDVIEFQDLELAFECDPRARDPTGTFHLRRNA